ncbi:MAG: glycosyltransferase [Paludibacter sp.]|nr:glycosyltransferase [Paludibacter sp.]
MLSIIICSRYKTLSEKLVNNITETAGVDVEIIPIDNSDNKYSIFSAYNTGYKKANFEYLCFLHEDISFKTHNWGQKLIQHLSKGGTGFVGIAGGNLATRIPSSWSIGEKYIHIIQNGKKNKPQHILSPIDKEYNSLQAVLLDGVFLGTTSEVMKKCKFDESMNGFHGYDLDICLQSINFGFKNYVVFDILIEHFSNGNRNYQYYQNQTQLFKKWTPILPLFVNDEKGYIEKNIHTIEKKALSRFAKNLARSGWRYSNIYKELRLYSQIVEQPADYTLSFLLLEILSVRLFERPKYLFKF